MHQGTNTPPDEVKKVFTVMSESEEPKPSKNFVKEGPITDGVFMT